MIEEESNFEASREQELKIIKHIDDGSDRSITSKESVRQQLQMDIENYLRNGGAVQTIAPHITADPPKKPMSSYGSRPI